MATKLLNFGGMIPAVDDRLLPDAQAAYARDTWLYSGSLAGIRELTLLRACTFNTTKKVFRIPKSYRDKAHLASAWWIEFDDADTDVIHSPVTDDSFDRYYWACGTDSPRYRPVADIQAAAGAYHGSNGYLLGIPAPAVAPTIAAAGGVSGVDVSRSYVYTWVSAFGEEGPPSPPVVETHKEDDTWTITVTAPTADNLAQRNLSKTRIYRTVTSSAGVATYFFVAEIDIATLNFADNVSDTVVTGNDQLQSTGWTAPPDDLAGWVAMPNGMIAGWRNNEIWFCEPYRPHAWPVAYVLTVEVPIVGLGVIGQTLIVCTTTTPYACTGVSPDTMTLARIATLEPCMSRSSILSAPEGVYYASPTGIVLASDGVVRNVTRELLTKDKWQELVDPTRLRAARVALAYLAYGAIRLGTFETTAFETSAFEQQDFTNARSGMLVDMIDSRVGFNLQSTDEAVLSITTDVWTNEILFTMEDGNVYWLDISSTAVMRPYLWRSKILQTAMLKNFGAMRVWFTIPSNAPTLNPVRNTALDQTLADDQYGLVRIYADDRLVMCRELRTSGEIFRMPSGFKAEFWQVEVEARVQVNNIEIGTTVKDLGSV